LSRVSSRPSSSHSFNWKLLIPNAMTAARLLLIIPFVYFVLHGEHLNAGITALVAMVSDVDGTIARKIGATSKFGALFDPLVDAAFALIAYGFLIIAGWLWLWPTAFFVVAAIYKSIPQTAYLRRHGAVRSVKESKTMGMVGFGTVVIAAFGAPLWLSATTLVLGGIGYILIGTRWLRETP
jgi:cardiolipin synthase (CMP-forming)